MEPISRNGQLLELKKEMFNVIKDNKEFLLQYLSQFGRKFKNPLQMDTYCSKRIEINNRIKVRIFSSQILICK